jgi:hypothetical protein
MGLTVGLTTVFGAVVLVKFAILFVMAGDRGAGV